MAVLKAYLDDSGDDTHAWIGIAGYVGTVKVWGRFEPQWEAALLRHDIEYFHMSEIPDPKSPMHKFCGKAGAEKLKALLSDLTSALGESSILGQFTGVGGVVLREALGRFNAERGRSLEAIPLALFTSLALMQSTFPDQTVEALLDRIKKAERAIAIAKEYLVTSPKLGGKDLVSVIPAKGDINAKTVRPLQAADFAAYEALRKVERLNPFFKSVDLTGATQKEYWYKYETWRDRNGRPSPDERRSLTALGDATKFRCPIWTYEVLCAEDDARNGHWES